ncbi:MmgE/PrpD family protein [Novosphingobium sp. TH158]|uniref:MmgE/PrpD family protein n=1 Tax=Novosphingobium sp. TH158 TaxID=2067455 RepID=UPI00130461C0|nr:MmgE/PrpD family protein [Novosphingobium sp. TH158]
MAATLRLGDVAPAVVARAKLHILDALGLGLASSVQDFGRSVMAGTLAMAGEGPCSVIGRSERLPLRDAAMVNGTLVHGLDFDDTHLASIIHATATALPAALALGEALDASGADMLAAFVAGAETAIRVGLAVDGGFHHTGHHATSMVSHFASAVTAGRLLGLSGMAIGAAQGIAGSTASGIQVFLEEGAWTKRFHPGWGAVAGITAAYLAEAQFKAPSRVYEGRFGLFHAHLHGQETKNDELTRGLGEIWHFGETALKPYPVCHFIHGCADAAIDLHREIAGADIVSVEARLGEPTLHIVCEPEEAKRSPTNEYEVKFSAHFVVAYCLLHGRFGLPDLLPAAIADPAALALARKVTCKADPDSRFPEFYSGGVTVTLADGRVLSRHVPVNSGAGENALSAEQVAAKFMASASLAIDEAQAGRVLDRVMRLESIPVRQLAAALRTEEART